MSSLIRPRLLIVAGLALVALIGATQLHGTSAQAGEQQQQPHQLAVGTKDGAQPQTMNEFLTAVTKDVDAYWTKVFAAEGLPEPRLLERLLGS